MARKPKPHVEALAHELADRYGVKGAKALVEDVKEVRAIATMDATVKKDKRERLVEHGDGGFSDVRRTYRLALHQNETMKRRMKAAKNRVEESEGDLRNAAENVPFNPSVMTELAAELAKRIITREGIERDLKRTRANLRAATDSYVAFEDEDPQRGT